MYAIGVGDCRHHAEATQLFFDIWRTDKLKEYQKSNATDKQQALRAKRLRVVDMEKKISGITFGHTYNVFVDETTPDNLSYRLVDSFHPHVESLQRLSLEAVGDDIVN